MPPTKTRALSAALELLGAEGVRALTHARVDARAGLPKGSTSNFFRTRAALLSGVVDYLVEQELSGMGEFLRPGTVEEFVDGLCAVYEFAGGQNRTFTAARFALFVEAGHNLEVRQAVGRGRARYEELAVAALGHLEVPRPSVVAAALMSCLEGLLLHRIARDDATDPRPLLELILRPSGATR
ncbi:TetR/AcrR family transcriptional regulator [Arthrobacter sp. HLT1-20]